MDKTSEMILFHGHSDCDVPTWLLTEPEKQLLERNGYTSPDFSFRYRYVSVYDFPGIFYRETLTPFHEEMVPRYVQALFKYPRSGQQGKWYYDSARRKEETEAINIFRDDLREFPVDELYQAMFQLQNIKVEYDSGHEGSAMAAKAGNFSTNGRVLFGRKSRPYLREQDYVHCVLLHELCHHVEFKKDQSVKNLKAVIRGHPRWTIERVGNQKTRQIVWSDGKKMVAHEVAELVAALSFVRHPEAEENVRPYQQSLLEQMSGQLPLFPEPERTWYDSRP